MSEVAVEEVSSPSVLLNTSLPSTSPSTETTSKSNSLVVICNTEGEGPSNYLQRAIAVDNKVIIYGGENSTGFWTNSLCIIDGESKKLISWKKPRCFDFPPKTDGHSLVVFNNDMIIFGGTDNQWINGGNNCVYRLNLETFEWTVVPENGLEQDTDQIPQGRKQHSTATVADKMYIFGGISSQVGSDQIFNDVFVYDNETKLWNKVIVNGDSPSPRSGHSMVYNQKSESLIVFGGKVGGGSYNNEVWSLSLSSMTWTLINPSGNIPCSRENHSAAIFNDNMIIYGGWTVGGPKNDLYSLDLQSFEWKKYSHNLECEKDSKRFGHASVCVDGEILIFGGKNHLFNNQSSILKFSLDKLPEIPVETEKPKEKKEIEEIILDLDEKHLSEEMFNKPNFDPKDVVLYKNIFDQLTEENIKQYEELNTMLLKQKLFSAQVESLIDTNRTLMAKEFTSPPPYTESISTVPIIYSEVVETPQSYNDLMSDVFKPTPKKEESATSISATNEEHKPVDEQPPKLPEAIPIVEEDNESQKVLPTIPESPQILESVQEEKTKTTEIEKKEPAETVQNQTTN